MDSGQNGQGVTVSPLNGNNKHNAPSTEEQQTTPIVTTTTPATTTTIADSVNSTNVVESLKGRIIATNKLLKLVEATKSKTEQDKIKISNLTKQLDNYVAENAKLQKQITEAEAAKKDLEKKLALVSDSGNEHNSATLKRDLEQALEQKRQKESLLSSREMYTKQLEAQLDDLESRLTARNKEAKKKDESPTTLEKMGKQIKDLKMQLDKALKDQELAEEDKMEMSITNEMLQRDHDELKEQLEKQQQEHITASANLQQQQETLQQKLRQLQSQLEHTKQKEAGNTTTNREELENVLQKLRASHTRIAQLENEVARLKMEQSTQMVQRSPSTHNSDYAELIVEFRKCLAENETMKKEKRVLQDKLTEQLLINDDIKTSKRNAILSQHGLNTSTLTTGVQDLYTNPAIDFEEIEYPSRPTTTLTLERHSPRHRLQSPLDEMVSDPYTSQQSSPTQQLNTEQHLHRRSSSNTMAPEQQHTTQKPMSFNQLHSSHTTIPEQSSSLRQKSRATIDRPSLTKNTPAKRTLDNDSRIAYGANGLVIPQSQIDRPAPSLQTRKPKLTPLEKRLGVRRPQAFGAPVTSTKEKRKSETSLTPRKKRIIFDLDADSGSGSDSTDSELGSSTPSSAVGKQKLPTKAPILPKATPTPEEFIKSQAEQFAQMAPINSQHLLEGMKTYMESYLDFFLASLETIYQRMKSHNVSVPKSDVGYLGQVDSYGLPSLVMLEGCPKATDWKEKNIAWALWALISQNSKFDLYSRIIRWASENILRFMAQAKVNLACRYTRLFMLISKNAKDKARVSVFCYDLIRWSPRNANIIPPVVNIALIWPDILDLRDEIEEAAGTNMIIKAIQRACAHYCNGDKSPHNVQTIYDYMTRLVGWPGLNQARTLQDYILELKAVLTLPDFKLLYNANQDAFNDLRINLVKSFELSFWRLDNWNAVYDGFIVKDLWALMSDEVLSHVSLELMGLLARCGLSTGSENTGIMTLRQTFKSILEIGNNCPDDEFPLQIIAAKCLMMISRDDIANVKPVFLWHSQLKSSFVGKLTKDLDEGIKKLRPLLM
ncbi:hypothetical protein BC941DRAFT_60189 [Chlamydoabsidia padenii]|nr:hypothetical protein BC941DRAFT_60189 [Chlamydoabsidia padenii]